MSEGIEHPGNCIYCNDLSPGRTAFIPFDGWVSGILNSSCQTCRIVLQAIQKLKPQFLKGGFEFRGKTGGSNTHVWLSVHERCRVIVGIERDGRHRKEVDIQFYYSSTDTGMPSEIRKVGLAGDICSIPGDGQMWSFLRKCLNDCIKRHEKCKAAQDPTFYPKRLLQLARDESGKDILQLIHTEDHHLSSPYMTLSHCWGSGSPLCTTKENLARLLENIPLSELPRTFQDCVVAARQLGVRYIWIDSLCIVQDDRKDWARHVQCMDKIYENALFTLAAVSSPNGSVPFLGPEAPSTRDNWQAINIDIDSESIKSGSEEKGSPGAQLKARRCEPYLLPSFFHGPLENRGWAWQERYLSVRIINFTKEEARWHCKTSQTCECFGVMQSMSSEYSASTEAEEGKRTSIREWRDIVTKYSRRQLTYSTDRLPALSGVASRFHASLQSEYLAGMWLTDFPRGLAWYRRELSDCSKGKPKMWRSLDNGVPSWSWASVFGQSFWIWDFNLQDSTYMEDIPLESQVELISTSCRPSSDNIFGEVEAGSSITLRGRVVEAEMDSDIHSCACVRRKGFGPQHLAPDCHIISATASLPFVQRKNRARRATPRDRLDESLSEGGRSKGLVWCLLLFTTTQNGKSHACVLILGKLAGPSDRYQRLGIGNSDPGWGRPIYKSRKDWEAWKGWEELEEWEEWEKWFEDAKVRTLKIV